MNFSFCHISWLLFPLFSSRKDYFFPPVPFQGVSRTLFLSRSPIFFRSYVVLFNSYGNFSYEIIWMSENLPKELSFFDQAWTERDLPFDFSDRRSSSLASQEVYNVHCRGNPFFIGILFVHSLLFVDCTFNTHNPFKPCNFLPPFHLILNYFLWHIKALWSCIIHTWDEQGCSSNRCLGKNPS